jgi:hypothetical protein
VKYFAGSWQSEFAALLVSGAAAACVLDPPEVPPRAAPDVAAESASPPTPASPAPDDERPEPPPLDVPQFPVDPPPPVPSRVALAVPGFPDAVVAVPSEMGAVLPVAIVLHGLGGRPEPNCDAWRNITEGRAFVLCPRGDRDAQRSRRSDTRYTLAGGAVLQRHVDAALLALAGRFDGRVDTSRPLLAGFSLGATEAARLAQDDPRRFPRVAILDGGVDSWLDASVEGFFAKGGERVLFGCGSTWCTPPADAASRRLELRGVESRVVFADVGHTTAPKLQAAVREQLAWLLADDGRWGSWGSASK